MKLISKERKQAVEKAGRFLINSKYETPRRCDNNIEIGKFMIDHPEKILKLLIRTKNKNKNPD